MQRSNTAPTSDLKLPIHTALSPTPANLLNPALLETRKTKGLKERRNSASIESAHKLLGHPHNFTGSITSSLLTPSFRGGPASREGRSSAKFNLESPSHSNRLSEFSFAVSSTGKDAEAFAIMPRKGVKATDIKQNSKRKS